MNPSLKSLLPAALLLTGSAHAALTYTDSLNIEGWLQIRDVGSTSSEWRISFTAGDTLSFRSESGNEAALALHVDNTAFEGAVGRLVGYRHGTDLHTQIGLKDEQDKWVMKTLTNLTTSPKIFKTEFFSDGSTIAGFYGDKLGVGTDSPSAKLHVRNDFIGTSSTAGSVTGVFGVATTETVSSGNLTLFDSTGGGLKNRFTVYIKGSGTVTQASAVSGGVDVNNGSLTNGASFHAETLSVLAGKSVDSYSGLWVRGGAVSGSLTNHYGVRVDPLIAGTNRYGLYITSDPTFLGGTLTVDGEVSGTGITTTSAANKLVKTNSSGKIDASLIDVTLPANILTTTGNGSGLTGLTKAQVGLGNVDNTSDATKNAATATLTNKTLSGLNNTFQDIPQTAVTNLTSALASKANASVTITAGTGLTGGGNLSSGVTIGLSQATVDALANAGSGGLAPNGDGSLLTGVVHNWFDLPHVYYDVPNNGFIIQAPDATDSVGIDSRILFGNWTAEGNLSLQASLILPDNIRQTFNPGATVPGLNVGSHAGNPSSPIAGDVWYNSSTARYLARFGSSTHNFAFEGMAQTLTNKTISGSSNTITNLNATNLTTGTVSSARGGAGTITGLLKANGAGVVSEAVAGQDYVVPAALAGKVDTATTISAENGLTATGDLSSGVVIGLSAGTIAALNNTTLNAANLTSGTVPSERGGAGSITGLLKANGAGVVSQAVPGMDYLSPAAAELLVPKTTDVTAGSGIAIDGDLSTGVTVALSQDTLDALANAGSGSLGTSGGTVNGDLAVTGTLTAPTIVSAGVIRVAPAGNLSMGIFTGGDSPTSTP